MSASDFNMKHLCPAQLDLASGRRTVLCGSTHASTVQDNHMYTICLLSSLTCQSFCFIT